MFKRLLLNDISTEDISTLFNKNVSVSVLRLDRLHPVISGNKWFKLRYYLEEAERSGKQHILTFGGAWSNHIAATAEACRLLGLSSTGIIRGEEPALFSPTLLRAAEAGMRLIFLSRAAYRSRDLPAEFLSPSYYHIPEGGYGRLGAQGAATIIDQCHEEYTHYCCAVGTGTMMAGLINALPGKQVIGISVLKNNADLEPAIEAMLLENDQSIAEWTLLHDYHAGGYAKYNTGLLAFMNDWYTRTGIPSDFIYTAKLFYAFTDLLERNYFPNGSRILLIHSGGLQGNASLAKGTLIF